MPSFGICTKLDNVELVKSAGFDFVELPAASTFDGLSAQAPDLEPVRNASLPTPCCNLLLPEGVPVTGEERSDAQLNDYIGRLFERAASCGVSKLVFGSGGRRKVRDGQSRDEAREQILDFLRLTADAGERHGVTLVIEPLRSAECNILTTVGESMEYVRAIDHPRVQCLVDSYHLWEENEPLSNLAAAMPSIKHVHVADRSTRSGPGMTEGVADEYRAFFSTLKAGGYDGDISVEGRMDMDEATLKPIVAFLHEQWASA